MRHLFAKDLRILARSPLLLGLLFAYPVVIAVIVGFALTRGPSEPRVAFLNQVPEAAEVISIGGEQIDAVAESGQLFEALETVPVSSREEAIEMVREGEVLGALIVPPDITQKLSAGIEPAEVEVFYNAEDPVKRAFVENTITAQVADANAALTERFTEVALDYLGLIVTGGEFSFLGRDFDVLGLERAQEILEKARDDAPADLRDDLDQVINFSRLARDNLNLSDEVLSSVGTPIRVKQTVVEGGEEPLASFAAAIAVTVSLMFVAMLLAAGVLALEREENAFLRLVRGLVSRTGLLAEKALVAAALAAPLAVLMLVGIGLFVSLDFTRLPLWALAAVAGGLAFAALGLAIGALAREVRAASLLAFMLSLPVAVVSLVPSGSVSGGLYDVLRVIAALFPFKPTLDAMEAALGAEGGIGLPLLHLTILVAAFGLAGRLALRRFA
jgi:ABC-2 type transport system permease protein